MRENKALWKSISRNDFLRVTSAYVTEKEKSFTWRNNLIINIFLI